MIENVYTRQQLSRPFAPTLGNEAAPCVTGRASSIEPVEIDR